MTTLERLEAGPPEEVGQAAPIAIEEIPGETRIGRENVSLTYRTPVNESDITDPVPLVIFHGWGGPESAYRRLGEEIARRGKRSVTYGEGRSLGWLGDLNPLNLLKVAELSSKAAWATIKYVRDEFGHEKSDGYGHSLGTQTAVNVARHKPGHVRALVLDGALGLDDHSLWEMIGRTGEFGAKEVVPALGRIAWSHGPRTGWHALHYMARHPTRSLAEGLNAGSTSLHSRIEELVAQHGIGISAIHSPNDTYFPLEAVVRDSLHLFGEHFHARDDPEANHLAPQLDPPGTADLVMHALKQRLHPDVSPEPNASLAA